MKSLSSLGYSIRALTRDPTSEKTLKTFSGLAGVTPTAFDVSEEQSVRSAFEGVDVVYGVSLPDGAEFVGYGKTPGAVSEFEQGRMMVDVAKEKGVKLFVW